jgi:NADH-quinone oxidoreductase subunit L
MAHGFFKGLLFLGSGSVIHAVHEEQDMNRMGGLWRKIPITHATMLVGTLAIAGIPPLAGFFSKDEILGESFKFGFYWVWAIGFVVAGMTAFYMSAAARRSGAPSAARIWDRIHDRRTMTVPLILLAIPGAAGLAIGFPPENGLPQGWLEPCSGVGVPVPEPTPSCSGSTAADLASVAAAPSAGGGGCSAPSAGAAAPGRIVVANPVPSCTGPR